MRPLTPFFFEMACLHNNYVSPPLRAYLLEGKFFIATALASTLTKLSIRYVQQVSQAQSKNVSCMGRQSIHSHFLIVLCEGILWRGYADCCKYSSLWTIWIV